MPAGFRSWSTKIPPLALIPTGQSNWVHARSFAAKGGSAQPFQHCLGWLSSHVVNQIKELVWLRTILPEGKMKRLVFSQLVPTTGAGARQSVEGELLPELALIYTRFHQAEKWTASHRSLLMPRRSISDPAYAPSLCPCCSHSCAGAAFY